MARALVAVGAYPPDHSGAGLRLHRSYTNLSASDVEWCVATAGGRGSPYGLEAWNDVPVCRFRPTGWPWRRLLPRDGFKRLFVTPVDYVHIVGQSRVPNASLNEAINRGLPIVFELSIMGPGTTINPRINDADLRLAVANNPATRDAYRFAGIPDDRIWMRPQPVDCDHFRAPNPSERSEARSNLGLTDAPTILVLGRFGERKNQRLALEALTKIPDAHLVLAGPVFAPEDQSTLDAVRADVDAHGLHDRIHIIPHYVDDPRSLYWACDALAVPSTYEGAPNVMFEALATGIPVVVAEHLSMQPFMKWDSGSCAVPLDPASFSDGLQHALANRTPTGSRAADARRRFDRTHIDQQFLDLLKREGLVK